MQIRNVLSLFDGMRCGAIALERAGITYYKYFCSEIDKYARKIGNKNYPNAIELSVEDVAISAESPMAVFLEPDVLVCIAPIPIPTLYSPVKFWNIALEPIPILPLPDIL